MKINFSSESFLAKKLEDNFCVFDATKEASAELAKILFSHAKRKLSPRLAGWSDEDYDEFFNLSEEKQDDVERHNDKLLEQIEAEYRKTHLRVAKMMAKHFAL